MIAAAQTVTVLAPGEPHALAADGGWTCGANLLHFEPAILPGPEAREAMEALLRMAVQGRATASLRGPGQAALAPLIVRVGGLARRAPAEAACRAALGELCVHLLRHMRDAPQPVATLRGGAAALAPPPCGRPEIERALTYIESNLTRSISRQELARQVSFSPSYFSAIFREATGSSIPEYINTRRVRLAQELLRDPQARVSSVCYAVGFRDLTNFNRVFKRLVGATPRAYRRVVLGGGGDEDDAPASRR